MKSLYNIYEGILDDAEVTLSQADNKVILAMIFKDMKSRLEVKNMLYNEMTSNYKQLRRRAAFKNDKIYIQFMDSYGGATVDTFGFRLGTCNTDKDDVIVTMPNCFFKPMVFEITKNTSGAESMKLNAYLKNSTYELPKEWHWLYYDILKKLSC